MTQMRLTAVTAMCVTLAVTGCAKKAAPVTRADPPPAIVNEAPPPAPARSESGPAAVAAAAALTEDELFARKSLEQLNAERPLGDTLFDLDEATIRDDARATLQNDAQWLQRWTSTRVTIEGHSDSRGTSEYNLALAERRAAAVKEYLVSLGVDGSRLLVVSKVDGSRLLVVSKGEESPASAEEHEGCWQQNRRGHPVITAK
jgi:peptidoglycan-associated lipoprotein